VKDRTLIFARFRRGSNAQDANVDGSGLGLALAAWIAERHGTAIEVESTVSSGSTFSWTLPLAPEYWTEVSAVQTRASDESLPLESTQV